MKRNLIVLFVCVGLMGCSAVATKYKFETVTQSCYFWENCQKDEESGIKTKVILKKIPVEQLTCNGTGCDAKFASGGEMKGGQVIDLSGLQLKNQ